MSRPELLEEGAENRRERGRHRRAAVTSDNFRTPAVQGEPRRRALRGTSTRRTAHGVPHGEQGSRRSRQGSIDAREVVDVERGSGNCAGTSSSRLVSPGFNQRSRTRARRPSSPWSAPEADASYGVIDSTAGDRWTRGRRTDYEASELAYEVDAAAARHHVGARVLQGVRVTPCTTDTDLESMARRRYRVTWFFTDREEQEMT